MAGELEQARKDLYRFILNAVTEPDGSFREAGPKGIARGESMMDRLEAAIRRDERIRCWQEVQANARELTRMDSPLARNLVGWGSDLYGPGTDDVSWPVAVDRLLVPDHLLRAFDRRRPGTGYRGRDDHDD